MVSERVDRLARFVVVGCAAAAMHLGVVLLLVDGYGWLPLAANVAGWLAAFVVSFSGHQWLTFRAAGAPPWRAARRFFVLSMLGFVINELSYAAALHWTGWRYDVLLALILVAVAFITYLLSSRWAFLGKPER